MKNTIRASHIILLAFVLCLLSTGYGWAQMSEEDCHQVKSSMKMHDSCCSSMAIGMQNCGCQTSSLIQECCGALGCKNILFTDDAVTVTFTPIAKLPNYSPDLSYQLFAFKGLGRGLFTGLSPPSYQLPPVYLKNCTFLI